MSGSEKRLLFTSSSSRNVEIATRTISNEIPRNSNFLTSLVIEYIYIFKFILSLPRLFQIWRTPACSNKRGSRRIPNCCSTWPDNRSSSALGTYKTPILKLKPFIFYKIWEILKKKNLPLLEKLFLRKDRSKISYLGTRIIT